MTKKNPCVSAQSAQSVLPSYHNRITTFRNCNMFYPLKIKEIRLETADCVSILLEIPAELKNVFQFKSGQYLTFRTRLDGQEIRRSYSICSSPLENEWRVAVKKVPFGQFSTFANEQLKVGDRIETMPPAGKFTVQPVEKQAKNYLAIATGSGITPILSILKTVLKAEPKSQFTLIYGNQKRSSIIFKEAIDGLKNKYMTRLSVYHILSQEVTDAKILSGRIDEPKLDYFFKQIIPIETVDHFYICGQEAMTQTVRNQLNQRGVSPQKVHFELFATNKSNPKHAEIRNQKSEIGEQSEVTIRLDGVSSKMRLAYHGENVLDAAMKNGADLPFACKGGVCCTCKAKLVEGKVEMDVNYGLEAEEIAAGFILTCQSHPRTPTLIVDFDLKV
jgi:ring-1,2-phenylacetyl-CoA epoxidase subunit PaaE